MLTYVGGDLLQADVEALVNPVNTVGVMGKGLAAQFRHRYPQMFGDYAAACAAGDVVLGRMHLWSTGAAAGPRWIVNFPTKGHWRSPSYLHDIESGLVDLAAVTRDEGIASLAVPALGCGNGGLDWADVRPLIERVFADRDVDVRVYGSGTSVPELTRGRAALLAIIELLLPGGANQYQVHALASLLMLVGEPLNLELRATADGMYATNLAAVLAALDGQYLRRSGTPEMPVWRVATHAVGLAAADRIGEYPETDRRVQSVAGMVTPQTVVVAAVLASAIAQRVEDAGAAIAFARSVAPAAASGHSDAALYTLADSLRHLVDEAI